MVNVIGKVVLKFALRRTIRLYKSYKNETTEFGNILITVFIKHSNEKVRV